MNKNCSVVPLLSGLAASLLISHQMTKTEEGKRLKTLPGSKCCTVGTHEATETLLKASTDVYFFAARVLLYSSHCS